MPRERTPARKPAGPGRPQRRPRTTERTASSSVLRTPTASIQQAADAARRLPGRVSRIGITRRAIVLFTVLAVLSLSYVQSLRVYLVQQRDLATAQQQIAERSARVAELSGELERWRDPAYVKAQARARLGWVMPGEVGYRVIGRDGQILSGGTEIGSIGSHTTSDFDPRWWDRLGGSIATADNPNPTEP